MKLQISSMHGFKRNHLVDSNGESAKYSLSIISPRFHILFAMANMTLFRFYPGIILHECNTIFWIFHMSNIPAYLFFIVYTPCLIPFTNTLSITMTFLWSFCRFYLNIYLITFIPRKYLILQQIFHQVGTSKNFYFKPVILATLSMPTFWYIYLPNNITMEVS